MEITKKFKTTPKNIRMLYDIVGDINLKSYEAIDFDGYQFLVIINLNTKNLLLNVFLECRTN